MKSSYTLSLSLCPLGGFHEPRERRPLYLYAVPPDLACFATGAAEPAVAPAASAAVESRRGSGGDRGGGMVESLVALAGFKGQGAEDRGRLCGLMGRPGRGCLARELSPVQVELAVATVLSDESIRVCDLEVWVPDASGVLALSTALLYNLTGAVHASI